MSYPLINGAEINGMEGGGLASLRPVKFGPMAAIFSQPLEPMRPVRFGPLAVQFDGVACSLESLRPAQFGALGTVGTSNALTPLRPAHFGPMAVSLGATC